MKKLLILIFAVVTYSASAQISFRTGNVQLDSDLNTINAKANLDFGAFKADLKMAYNIAEKKIEHMKADLGMEAGEIYLALEIAKLSKKSVDDVITIYEENKSKGWGYIAKEAGIKPGSAEFHELKNNASAKKGKSKEKSKSHSKGKNNDKQNKESKKKGKKV